MSSKHENTLSLIVLTLFKAITYFLIFIIFFTVLATKLPQVMNLSRTAAITMLSFVFVGGMLMKIYGSYDVDVRKSRSVIVSLVLSAIITDLFVYVLVMIMNTNQYNNEVLEFVYAYLLVIVILLQIAAIIILVYFGNYCYFLIKKPQNVALVYGEQEGYNHYKKAIARFKKQYLITKEISCSKLTLMEDLIDIDQVFLYGVDADNKRKIIDYCYRNSIYTTYVPEVAEVVEYSAKQTTMNDIPIMNINIKSMSLEERFIKRALDIFISICGLIITSPIFIITAILIKLDDNGSVFYTQERLTRNYRLFNIYKFRTMIDNNDRCLASDNDERITRVGKYLRRFRIDELPQFINVLKGDMSIVGPRPEAPHFFDEFVKIFPEFSLRLNVKAGITGLAQIHGKYNTSPKNKLLFDLFYIEQFNIWLDFKLMLQTLLVLFRKDSTEGVDEKNKKEDE